MENKIKNLLKIESMEIGDDKIKTVNARDLHRFMEIGKDFSTWIRDRIKQYGFEKGKDFIILPRTGENTDIINKNTIGRPANECHLTLDMAKELSMVERNAKGKEARRYFIKCEKIVHEQSTARTQAQFYADNPETALLDAARVIEKKNQQIHQLQYTEQKHNDLTVADGCLSFSNTAKALNKRSRQDGFKSKNLGRNILIKTLRNMGLLMLKSPPEPYQHNVRRGLFEVVLIKITFSDRETGELKNKVVPQTFVTPKGIDVIYDLLFKKDLLIYNIPEQVGQG